MPPYRAALSGLPYARNAATVIRSEVGCCYRAQIDGLVGRLQEATDRGVGFYDQLYPRVGQRALIEERNGRAGASKSVMHSIERSIAWYPPQKDQGRRFPTLLPT